MTTYATINPADIDPDSPLTQSLMTRLRDNPLAIAEGDATAPRIQIPGNMHTAEMNPSLRLRPDGSGGVAWAASSTAIELVFARSSEPDDNWSAWLPVWKVSGTSMVNIFRPFTDVAGVVSTAPLLKVGIYVVQHVSCAYDGTNIKLVAIITDGTTEDSTGTLTLDTVGTVVLLHPMGATQDLEVKCEILGDYIRLAFRTAGSSSSTTVAMGTEIRI